MALAASGLRERGAMVHEKANQRAGEQQGAWRRLTAQQVGDEEGCAKLSTLRVFGTNENFAGGSRQCRRGSEKKQNGTGEVCRSLWRGKSGNGEGVRADFGLGRI